MVLNHLLKDFQTHKMKPNSGLYIGEPKIKEYGQMQILKRAISGNITFKQENIKWDKEGHFIVLKATIHYEDISHEYPCNK